MVKECIIVTLNSAKDKKMKLPVRIIDSLRSSALHEFFVYSDTPGLDQSIIVAARSAAKEYIKANGGSYLNSYCEGGIFRAWASDLLPKHEYSCGCIIDAGTNGKAEYYPHSCAECNSQRPAH